MHRAMRRGARLSQPSKIAVGFSLLPFRSPAKGLRVHGNRIEAIGGDEGGDVWPLLAETAERLLIEVKKRQNASV